MFGSQTEEARPTFGEPLLEGRCSGQFYYSLRTRPNQRARLVVRLKLIDKTTRLHFAVADGFGTP